MPERPAVLRPFQAHGAVTQGGALGRTRDDADVVQHAGILQRCGGLTEGATRAVKIRAALCCGARRRRIDGPCPPAGVEPFAHHYVFTVYALDTELALSASANFPANAETLYEVLIHAGREGHTLASGSIVGLFSATPD